MNGIKFTLKNNECLFLRMSKKEAESSMKSKDFNVFFTDENGKKWNFYKKDVKKMEMI